MDARAKAVLRWSVIVGSGSFGVYCYASTIPSLFTSTEPDRVTWWLHLLLALPVLLVFSPPLFIPYFVWRGDYRRLAGFLNGIGAVCVFFAASSLCRPLLPLLAPKGDHLTETPWTMVLGLAAAACLLLGPFYAAGWFYRLAQRLTTRWLFTPEALARDVAPLV